jgi:hypothetical protein
MMSRKRRPPAAVLRVRRRVCQSLDVAADGRERRAQLVRHVGHEVAADLVGAPEVRDVVQHEHRAALAGRGDRGRARDERAARIALHHQLETLHRPALERGLNLRGDVGVPDELQEVPARARIGQSEHQARGVVHELQATLLVDDEHAFDHARENRLHSGTIARLLGQAPPKLLHRLIQHPRHRSNLVISIIVHRA